MKDLPTRVQPQLPNSPEDHLNEEDLSIHSIEMLRWVGIYMLRVKEMEIFVKMWNALSQKSWLSYWFCISGVSGQANSIAAVLPELERTSVSQPPLHTCHPMSNKFAHASKCWPNDF
jgi:hypothetical protein